MTNNLPADSHPAWFTQAIGHEPRVRRTTLDGIGISYRQWGAPDKPGLVLIHGAMAHAGWWDYIAPWLAERFFVVAPHLSGMGDSDHRESYSTAIFADEVVAVMDHAGMRADTLVVGHSLGGAVALTCGHRHAHHYAGVVMLDSAVFPPHIPSPFDPAKAPYRPKTICPDYESAVSRFFLLPEQPCQHRFLLDHVVRHSVAQMGGGWSWKFDDALFKKLQMHEQWRELETIEIPLAIVYGDRSAIFLPPIRDYLGELATRRGWPMFAIPGGHHHLTLDSPRALIGTLLGLFSGWPVPSKTADR